MYSRNWVSTRMELLGTAVLTEYSYEDFPSRSNQSQLLRRKDKIKRIANLKFRKIWDSEEDQYVKPYRNP